MQLMMKGCRLTKMINQTDKSKRGRASRNKGAAAEREVSKILNEAGIFSHRGYVQFRQSDIVGVDGVHIEVKRQESLNLRAAMEQSEAAAEDGEIPVVIHRKDREKWRVTMNLEDWMELYKQWQKRNLL